MQIRRLVKSGLSSFTVALPKEWIEKNKLKKGDFLYIDEDNNKLSVSAEPKKEQREKKEIVINTEGKSEKILRREIRSAYINDYYRIYIKGSNVRLLAPSLKKDVHDLVSLEAIEESQDKIIARSFLDFSDVSVTDLIRRIDNITRSMMTEAISCIPVYPVDYDMAKVLTDRDADVNRLSFLVFKILKACTQDVNLCSKLELTNLQVLKYWHLVFIIEKVADEVKRITRVIKYMHDKKVKADKKELVKLFEEIKGNYEQVMKAFYKNDMSLADTLNVNKPAIIKKCEDYFEKNKSLEASEITGKLKGIISQSDDISKIIRYLN
ncbi:phosphate uptake regulator PhoU [Candidatus Woesearchaeota archaeon]|nr:phosphate uptake regulator PhoU [Candidatus Woesearchaeota archaeon]